MFPRQQPVLVEVVQLLQVLQGDLVLLAPRAHVDALERLGGGGLEVDDEVDVEADRALGARHELEPLVQHGVLAAQDPARPARAIQ